VSLFDQGQTLGGNLSLVTYGDMIHGLNALSLRSGELVFVGDDNHLHVWVSAATGGYWSFVVADPIPVNAKLIGVGVHDRSVGEVARLFNAYTTQPLRIADPALAARRISGVFHLRDPDAFVAYLRSLPNVQVHRDAHAVTIRSAPAPM
jgi:hypothetical protein